MPMTSRYFADRVRFVGDRVAAVVAESEAIAARARDLGEVMNMCLAPAVTAAVHDATGV